MLVSHVESFAKEEGRLNFAWWGGEGEPLPPFLGDRAYKYEACGKLRKIEFNIKLEAPGFEHLLPWQLM